MKYLLLLVGLLPSLVFADTVLQVRTVDTSGSDLSSNCITSINGAAEIRFTSETNLPAMTKPIKTVQLECGFSDGDTGGWFGKVELAGDNLTSVVLVITYHKYITIR